MRINGLTFNYQPQFRGINEAINKIRMNIKNKGLEQDEFIPASGDQTIIIQHYHEAEKSSDTDPSPIAKGLPSIEKGRMATNGVISGATTGGAIEGTKSVVNKIKSHKAEGDDTKQLSSDEPKTSPSDLKNSEVISENAINETEIPNTEVPTTNIDNNNIAEDIIQPKSLPITEIEPEIEPEIEVDIDLN